MSSLVSVIMPSYNHEKYVIKALESTKSLGHINIELIVIDDGSTDNSVNLIQNWFDVNEKHFSNSKFISRENRGVVSTLNELIDISNGKYIFILASDDIACEGAVERLHAYHRDHCNDDSVVYSEMNFIDDNGVVFGDIYKDINRTMLKTGSSKYVTCQMLLYWRPPFNLPFFTKKGFYEICKAYDEKYNFEDFYLALKYFDKGDIHFLQSKSYNYRVFNDERVFSRNYRVGMKGMINDQLNLSQGKKKLILRALSYCYSDNSSVRFISKTFRELILKCIILASKLRQ